MANKKSPVSDEIIALYDQLLARHPDIERKGAKMLYTSVNGHMFTLLNYAGELGIRLSKESQKAFLVEHDAEPFKSHGAFMRGYVTVPLSLLRDTDALAPYLFESYDYVRSLEPKPTKKKAK